MPPSTRQTTARPEPATSDPAIHDHVREGYARVAEAGPTSGEGRAKLARALGYDEEDTDGVAAEANLGLGCGNPAALARLQPGETVVDLGSGAGFDALLAAPSLGPTGRFIGVDMTPEMLERARTNATKAGMSKTVEFREGKIEALPVVSETVDVVISNCVINLSPDKGQVFREVFRVLKPGGRMVVSDLLLAKPLPAELEEDIDAWVWCLAGAISEESYLGHIRDAGFQDVQFEKVEAASLIEGAREAGGLDPALQAVIDALDDETLQTVAQSVYRYAITARRP